MSFRQIWTYDNYVSAHLDKSALEDQGITVWLRDENTVSTFPSLTNALGGIKLMVPVEDADRSLFILKKMRDDYQASIACPNCKSHDIISVTSPKKPENWILSIFTYFMSNVAVSAEVRYKCFSCGKSFDEPLRLETPPEGYLEEKS